MTTQHKRKAEKKSKQNDCSVVVNPQYKATNPVMFLSSYGRVAERSKALV